MPIASRCAESPCEKTATHPGIQARNDPYLLHREAGAKGLLPLSPAPQIPADPGLRFAPDRSCLTIRNLLHNHCASVASLRLLFTFAPECRSPSLGIMFAFTGIPSQQRRTAARAEVFVGSLRSDVQV